MPEIARISLDNDIQSSITFSLQSWVTSLATWEPEDTVVDLPVEEADMLARSMPSEDPAPTRELRTPEEEAPLPESPSLALTCRAILVPN